MKNTFSRMLATVAVGLAMTGLFPSANATVFTVNYNVTFENSAFASGGLFGVSSETTLDITFQLDDSVAPAVVIPVGTGGFGTALYGYDSSAISGLSVTFGTHTWTLADISDVIPVAGFTADVWFDEMPADGGTPNTWMSLINSGGYIQFGGGVCGAPCFLQSSVQISNFSRTKFASPLNVAVSEQSTEIPEPGALVLFGIALAGIGFARRRRTA